MKIQVALALERYDLERIWSVRFGLEWGAGVKWPKNNGAPFVGLIGTSARTSSRLRRRIYSPWLWIMRRKVVHAYAIISTRKFPFRGREATNETGKEGPPSRAVNASTVCPENMSGELLRRLALPRSRGPRLPINAFAASSRGPHQRSPSPELPFLRFAFTVIAPQHPRHYS